MRKILLLSVSALAVIAGLSGAGGCSSSATAPEPEPTPSEESIALSVSVTGVGRGRVLSDDGVIDCRKAHESDGPCDAELEEGSVVALTATPDDGYVFLGWGGDCAGASACTVSLDAARSVTAAFALPAFYSTVAIDGSDAANGAGVRNIFVMKTDGTELTPVTLTVDGPANSGSAGPLWSPDGERLAFAAPGVAKINDAPVSNVWTASGDGSGLGNGLVNLTAFATANSFSARWSPDGATIAFISDRRLDGSDALNDDDTRNLWLMDADGGNPRAVTATKAPFTDVSDFRWSPDGSALYFVSARDLDLSDHSTANFTQNVWAVRPDGADLRPLTALTADFVSHFIDDVSPDGAMLLLTANRALDGGDAQSVNGVTNLWIVPTDGSDPRPLTAYTSAGTFVSGPTCFSGDGSKAFYATNALLDGSDDHFPGQVRNVWSVGIDAVGARPLTELTVGGVFQTSFDAAADGSRLFFASERALDGSDTGATFIMNLWSMNEDGTDQRPLTAFTVPNLDQKQITVSR